MATRVNFAFNLMNPHDNLSEATSRREFIKHAGLVAGASALVGAAIPRVHAAEDNTIRVALVGCGGRGTGAAGNALSVANGPTRLVAMADVFEGRLSSSFEQLRAIRGLESPDSPGNRTPASAAVTQSK